MGQPDLVRDPRFSGNPSRVQNVEELDRIITAWTMGMAAAEADHRLSGADIPCTLIYTAAEVAADPQFRERGMVREIDDPRFGKVLQPGIVPHVPENPGVIRWPGPPLGAHNDEVLGEMLGLGAAEIEMLRQEGVL
jgi:crotonobetainyl-CoA:carnitine CoA-transferase CaiB-like acyl-CoA transferase